MLGNHRKRRQVGYNLMRLHHKVAGDPTRQIELAEGGRDGFKLKTFIFTWFAGLRADRVRHVRFRIKGHVLWPMNVAR